MSYETIECEQDNDLLLITLSRANNYNAFNKHMANEIIRVLADASHNDSIKAIIVTGKGKYFCAGADLGKKETAMSDIISKNDLDLGGKVALEIFNCCKPIIAAINGPAIGTGITLTLPMDMRLSATGVKFGFVFSQRGIIPESCSSWFLPRIVGVSKALEWTYSGKIFNEKEAFLGGLINAVYPSELLLIKAKENARKLIEDSSQLSVSVTRKLMWSMLTVNHPSEAHILESKLLKVLGALDDAREGVKSFQEKRPSDFKGKVSDNLSMIDEIINNSMNK